MANFVAGNYYYQTKKGYKKAVAIYKVQNPTTIYKVFRFLVGKDTINYIYFEKALNGKFPKAEWLGKDNMKEQIVSLLTEMGFVFTISDSGDICFKDAMKYERIVKNHLLLSGKDILDRLDRHFVNFGGSTINYKVMNIILGRHFPKAPYVDKSDLKACIILFMYHLGIVFKFDDDYLYFA